MTIDLMTATPEQVGVVTVVEPVLSIYDGGLRYVATATVDGVPTSFDCTHLHHSPAAAAKCLRRVEASFRKLLDEAEVRTLIDARGLVEFATHVTGVSRGGQVCGRLRRVLPHPDVEVLP